MHFSPRLNRIISLLALAALLVVGYSLLLGRGRAIPERIDYRTVRHVVLTYGEDTRVLRTVHVNEIEALTEALAAVELKPGLAPILPDPEVATMTFWYTRGKFENKYIIMENSVMKTEGLALPYHYVLIDDRGLTNLIRQIVAEPDPIGNYTTPQDADGSSRPEGDGSGN